MPSDILAPTALIVDDEADIGRLIQMGLKTVGVKSDVAYDLSSALEKLASKHYDFCLTDINLKGNETEGDQSGMQIVRKLGHQMPIAVITAHGDMDMAIEAMRLGAFDFVNKPVDLPVVQALAKNALKVNKSISQTDANTVPTISPEDELLNTRLIGNSEPMIALRATIKKMARSQAPVFLFGGSGTGKEVVAKLIHDLSPRKDGSFVPVNCGAIPSELMESEFFGHKKGSFTGATSDKIGLFQQAHGGTLFLDEVADLPLAMQVKLLRAIQEKTVRAIGDTKEVPVDVRILSATHKDLTKLVQAGSFREDLFYRINVIMVKLPTLNERREDIGILATHFLTLISNDWQIEVPKLSNNALACLHQHNFKGNVRELRNLLERAITMTEGNEIDAHHLFGESLDDAQLAPKAIIKPIEILDSDTIDTPKNPYQDNRTNYVPNQISIAPTAPTPKEGISIKVGTNYSVANNFEKSLKNQDDVIELSESIAPEKVILPKEGLEAYLRNQEKMLIIAALAQADNNKTQAAKLLGMTFRSFRYRMDKLEIESDDCVTQVANSLNDIDNDNVVSLDFEFNDDFKIN